MKSLILEIWSSLRRNKMRTSLTGFSVFWGIFMLIVLLGAGNGLKHRNEKEASQVQANSMRLWTGTTSVPYAGYQMRRRVPLTESDLEIFKRDDLKDRVEEAVPTVSVWNLDFVWGKKRRNTSMDGNCPEYFEVEKIKILAGRAINQSDMDNFRKVLLIPASYAEYMLDGGKNYECLIGERVKVNNLNFTVTGVWDDRANGVQTLLLAPFTTVRKIFGTGHEVNSIALTFKNVTSEEESEELDKDILHAMNRAHSAAPDDASALGMWNRFPASLAMQKSSRSINTAVWVIGLLTLISGVVGVSNIMLITVKERTHEFGIRRAIGSRPWGIIRMIVLESVLITTFFGYCGLCAGLMGCAVMDKTLGSSTMSVLGSDTELLINPTVGLDVAMEVTAVMIIAGVIAGLFPAIKAAHVKPIEALRAR